MITKAAVKVRMLADDREITIPCHRHCDAFYILHEFGYKQSKDYVQVAQGFLDEHDNFYDRIEAHRHAWFHFQLPHEDEYEPKELFSEDLY